MRNENHHFHHYHHHNKFYQQNLLHIHQRSTFLPMLCSRPSIKDVSVPRLRDKQGGSSSNDPLSPRIGCMGQVVKKKRNNKIAGFPTSHNRLSFTSKNSSNSSSSNSNSSSPIVKYSKLKKIFSGKNLTTTPTTTTTTTSSTTTIISRQRVTQNQRCGDGKNENLVSIISIDDMDPPLPVINKRVHKLEEGSLWKRRSGGSALKTLQLQQIHHPPRICLQPTSV